MYRGLDLGINPHHRIVNVGVIPHEDLGVPSGGNENGVDTTRYRCRKDVSNLQTDEEREEDDDCGVFALAVVFRFREDEVEVGEERAGVGDEKGAEGENGTDETFL